MQYLVLLLVVSSLATKAFAQMGVDVVIPTHPSETFPAVPTLISEYQSVQPGQTFAVGLRFRLQPGWHVYWFNPGDSGLPPKLNWTLANGVGVSEFTWPTPRKFSSPPLASYGYAEEVLLPMTMTLATDFKGASFVAKANAQWLVCKEQCLMRKGNLELTMPVQGQAKADLAAQKVFNSAKETLPKPLPFVVTATKTPKEIELALMTASNEKIEFFPSSDGIIDDSGVQTVKKQPGQVHLKVPRDLGSSKTVDKITGLLVIGGHGYLIDTKVN